MILYWMSFDMNVRLATITDLNEISSLFDTYRVFYRQLSNIDQSTAFVRERFLNQQSWILVVEQEGRLVGFSQLYPMFSSVSVHRLMVLNDLFVVTEKRGTGLGRALISASQRLAKEMGFETMTIATEKGNAKARQLYPEIGFKEDSNFIHYTMTLND
ncbi:MAG: GNAT family N-acetyltransferase [Gammaproteobacteria bacterium]|nr:GNAT family N-acetyltransferase [Gammaproteobacteria bacterium]MBQ0775649.1 GNAT family N-acetyltransferase [Gammaproteobacteria bacterium]